MTLMSGAQMQGPKWQPVKLSDPEKQLAKLVAQGCTDDEIAKRLTVQRRSVQEQIERLLSKIGGRERVEILFYLYSEPGSQPAIAAMPRLGESAQGYHRVPERKAS
jgi:DNA-binding NarL/FixJ family response regulator